MTTKNKSSKLFQCSHSVGVINKLKESPFPKLMAIYSQSVPKEIKKLLSNIVPVTATNTFSKSLQCFP
jgi:hypothetical protein